MGTEFTEWPIHYTFPPFFTIQPNQETRSKQISIWIQLIKDYCSSTKQFSIGKDHPIFGNVDISRSVSDEGRGLILSEMVKGGHGEWIQQGNEDRIYVWSQSKESWAKKVMEGASEHGLLNSVATLYELMNDIPELEGMEEQLLIRILKSLQEQGKCELMGRNGGSVEGVKFFI